jgi:hypothetical protein
MLSRIEPAMSFSFSHDHAAPPTLVAAGTSYGQSNHIARSESVLHDATKMPETKAMENV